MTDRQRTLAVALALLLLATALRFHRLGSQSFWNDEGNSARLSERSFAAILEGTASDIHPPLYYLMLRGWRELAGETEFGLRSLSALAGVLLVAVVGVIAQGGRGAFVTRHSSLVTRISYLVSLLLAAVSPVLIYYSQETRMYALLALWAALGTWALLNWLAGGGRRWAVAYVALTAAGLYTHYFYPAVVVGQGVVVWLEWGGRRTRDGRRRPGSLRRIVGWLGLASAAVVLYAPWAPIFLRQVGGRGGEQVALPAFLAEAGRWLALGSTAGRGEAVWALLAALALAIMGVAVGGRRSAVALPLLVVPMTLMVLVGATDPAFFKFLLVVVPFLCLLMGLAWDTPGWRRWLAAVLTALVLAGSALSLGNLYGNPAYARADYRGIAARIAADEGNAAVILVAPNQWEVFTYYHRDGAPVYPLPLGRPDPALVEPALARIAAAHDRLYVLYWGEAQRDPESVIERWLDTNAFKASEEWVGDVRLAVYAVAREGTGPATPSGAAFTTLDGETITLREFTVWPREAGPGEVVQARLAWETDATPARAYKVFLHLLAADGSLAAQRDGEPAGGSRPTTGWRPDEAIIDNHGLLLPPALPPGDYALRLGLYDALDPAARLPVAGSDSLSLGNITITEQARAP